MSENAWLPSTEELIETHESPEEILKTLQEDAPELPEKFQDMSREELLDMPSSKGTDEEAAQLAEYLLYSHEVDKRYSEAKKRMD